jgi:hypothetical protein
MMNDLKQAYDTLGLPENATREEVEKRYEILLRRERQREIRKEDGGTLDFREVNRAYRFIIDHENEHAINTINEQEYGRYKGYAKQAEKLDHFFSYYKWRLFAGIAAVALIIYGIIAYVDHRAEQSRLAAMPPTNLEASFLGRFYLPSGANRTEELEAAILEQFPEWQRVEADILGYNMASQDSMDYAMLQKVTVQLATERPDVYILDSDSYQWIARNGVLVNLDNVVEGRFRDLLPEGAAVRAFVPDRDDLRGNVDPEAPVSGEEHVFGIDIGRSPLAEKLPLHMQEMIVGIRLDAKHPENALLLIERYLEALTTR